jgi:outer membrane protein assembly factor BamB
VGDDLLLGVLARAKPDGNVLWTLPYPPLSMTGCFADGSGSAYCGSPLTAVSPDGQVAFTLPIQQPAVLRHDGIFVGAGSGKENAGKLVAVRRDGTTVWSSVPVGDVVVDGEDTAYVTSTMGKSVHAIDANGNERWSLDVEGASNLVLGREHELYVVAGKTLYAIGP